MKHKLIAAALAAFFIFPFSGAAAFAAEPNGGSLAWWGISEDVTAEETPPASPITDYPESNPFTPSGAGTVVDNATGEDGKEFYTVMTPDEHVFYLVIDKQRGQENVYFLNAVTVADLAALAELPKTPPVAGPVAPPAEQTPASPTPTSTPAPVQEPGQNGGNTVMYIIIAVLAVLGGGAGWYFKVYRPKQQGAAGGAEYEPPVDEADRDYLEDWNDELETGTDDTPQWDVAERADDESDGESEAKE